MTEMSTAGIKPAPAGKRPSGDRRARRAVGPSDSFTDWLADILEARDWSMRELARRSGSSAETVCKVLNGERPPSYAFCIQIAHTLRMSEGEVLRRAGLLRSPAVLPDQPDLAELVETARQLSTEKRAYLLAVAKALLHGVVLPAPGKEGGA